MTLNGINLFLGFVVGLALGILLQRNTPPDREDNVHVMRRPMAKVG